MYKIGFYTKVWAGAGQGEKSVLTQGIDSYLGEILGTPSAVGRKLCAGILVLSSRDSDLRRCSSSPPCRLEGWRWLKDLPVFHSEQNTAFSKFLCGFVYSFLSSANVCLLGHQILKRKDEPAVSSLDYYREAHFRAKQIIAAQATKCCY